LIIASAVCAGDRTPANVAATKTDSVSRKGAAESEALERLKKLLNKQVRVIREIRRIEKDCDPGLDTDAFNKPIDVNYVDSVSSRIDVRKSHKEMVTGRLLKTAQLQSQIEDAEIRIREMRKKPDDILRELDEFGRECCKGADHEAFREPITIEYCGIGLHELFKVLSKRMESRGLRIEVSPDVKGKAQMWLVQVPIGEVMDAIVMNQDLDRVLIGDTVYIGTKAEIRVRRAELWPAYDLEFKKTQKKLQLNENEIERLKKEIEKYRTELLKIGYEAKGTSFSTTSTQ
jgi:hypothetical protein